MILKLVAATAVILVAIFSFGHPLLMLVAAVILLGLYKAGKWMFWPRHELPRHRVRDMKLRLFCRAHPGRGHATVIELWRHWSARASAEKDKWARP